MANKQLFKSQPSSEFSDLNTMVRNAAGGKAYPMSDRHALAQLVMTGTFSNTFYVSAQDQLTDVIRLSRAIVKTDPSFVGKLAIAAREQGYMKDSPAVLLAILATTATPEARSVLSQVFNRVVDNGKILRNFVQIIRSGAMGRKSFGSFIKKLIQKWIVGRNPVSLFKDSVGNNPSLADVIKLTHPKPNNEEQISLFSYLVGNMDIPTREGRIAPQVSKLPSVVREYEAWKLLPTTKVPQVPFQLLTMAPLTTEQWTEIAMQSSWQTIRMNLNTFLRHGVFNNAKNVEKLANRLTNNTEILRSKVFPYQLFSTYKNISTDMPTSIVDALETATEVSTQNIPEYSGKFVICPDVSGSMSSPITGHLSSGSSKIRCIDVAALISSAFLRKNSNAQVVPFNGDVVSSSRFMNLNAHNKIMENSNILSSLGGGNTDCSAPLRWLNSNKISADVVFFISDNESWLQKGRGSYHESSMMQAWSTFKKNNENAKLICLDLTPNKTIQVKDFADVLNIGGFSDHVFTLISDFIAGNSTSWVSKIESLVL